MKHLGVWVIAIAAGFVMSGTANAGMLDYDGDGKDDVGVYHSDSGNWYLLESSTDSQRIVNWGWKEAQPAPGDYDGDGKADVAVFILNTGTWVIYQSGNNAVRTLNWGSKDSRPVPGDYDGDGKTDVAVYERNSGRWTILLSSNGATRVQNFGWFEAKPIPGDYDGDGKTDLAVFHRATGNWYINQSGNNQTRIENFGIRTMRPVPADYDGDGKTDLAMYERTTGNWYIFQSAAGFRQVNWGFARAAPAPADYDGDGKTDVCVFERASGKWYISNSSDNSARMFGWGWNQVSPLPLYRDGGIAGLIIVAHGDSITFGTSSACGCPDTGYPYLLERVLGAALGGHYETINTGDPGEETMDGLRRLGPILATFKPDLTLIMEGTNDTFFNEPYSTIEANLRGMVSLAKNAGSEVILATIPPVIKSAYRDRSAQARRIVGFNPRIYQIGASMGIPVAQVFEAITSVPGWQTALIDQETANHPNDAGYRVVRDEFLRTIRNAYIDGLFY